MPIRVLEPTVAAQIAAGEVVERPASVVKELVENALDAGARRITVSVRGGGVEELVIQDDGSGIPADEIETAFARHATSKLRSADDLWAIQTLGFRGEALPSIAAVAQVICASRTADSPGGVELRIAGGEVQHIAPRGGPVGTTFTIRNLFYNVPVRREFLKSPAAESGAIAAVVTQYALAYPQIAFALIRDGKRVFQTSGRGRLADVILELYGVDVARQMLPVEARAGEDIGLVHVQGMVSAPSLSRSSRDGMHITVNGRAIAPRGQVGAIVEEAYHTLLMKGRFPLVVLHLEVHPAAVDVNVHPTKSEVKFRNPLLVARTLGRAVREAVQGTGVIQGWYDGAAPEAEPEEEAADGRDLPREDAAHETPPADLREMRLESRAAPVLEEDVEQADEIEPADDREAGAAPLSAGDPWSAPAPPLRPDASRWDQPAHRDDAAGRLAALQALNERRDAADAAARLDEIQGLNERRESYRAPEAPPPAPAAEPIPLPLDAPSAPGAEAAPAPTAPAMPALRALAQLGLTYILAEGPAGALYLIDQHAAHERITYERLMARRGAGPLDSQALLIPQSVALPPAAQETLLEAAEELAETGFALDAAGDGVVVRAAPAGLALDELAPTLADLASYIAGSGGATPADRREAALTTLACHTSVRAGQPLTPVEQQALIEQLGGCEGPRTCPHGRPTMIVITQRQLERQFGRLGA